MWGFILILHQQLGSAFGWPTCACVSLKSTYLRDVIVSTYLHIKNDNVLILILILSIMLMINHFMLFLYIFSTTKYTFELFLIQYLLYASMYFDEYYVDWNINALLKIRRHLTSFLDVRTRKTLSEIFFIQNNSVCLYVFLHRLCLHIAF
jgi:hypothetical protein